MLSSEAGGPSPLKQALYWEARAHNSVALACPKGPEWICIYPELEEGTGHLDNDHPEDTIGDRLRAKLWRTVMQDWSGIAGHWGPALEGQGIPEKRSVGGKFVVFGKMIVRPILLYCSRENPS